MIITEEELRNLGISEWALQQCKYACNSLPCFLKNKRNAEAIACLIAICISEVFETSSINFDIETAISYSLDIIGGNMFCGRRLLEDEQYRQEIKRTINAKEPPTTANSVINSFKQLYNCSQCFYSEEKYNTIALYASFPTEPQSTDFSAMKQMIANGVHLKVYYAVGENVISIINTNPPQYGTILFANGEPIIANNTFLCASQFTEVDVV